MSNNSIWPIDRNQSGATTPGQSGPGSNGNKSVLYISQISSITGTLLSESLISYLVRWGSFPSAEMQSVCSTVPLDRAYKYIFVKQKLTS